MIILFFVQGRRGLHFIIDSRTNGSFVVRDMRKIPSKWRIERWNENFGRSKVIELSLYYWAYHQPSLFLDKDKDRVKGILEKLFEGKVKWIEII